jgi:hypothetical protein
MFNHVLDHQFESALSIQGEQHVTTHVAFLALEKGCLLTAHSFDITIEVVDDLPSYPLNLLNVIDTCLFKQTLILTEY